MLATIAALAVSTLVYAFYATSTPAGPSGGTPVGITFGVVGFALMAFAGLLAARKKVRIWRIGRAQTWMRGHLWLGLLSLPLIFFHSGLSFGAGFTSVLMWLFLIVIVSGVAGAALQHYLPRVLLEQVPMETIFEQLAHVRGQLLDESDALVASACGALEVETAAPPAPTPAVDTVDRPGVRPIPGREAALATIERIDAEESAPLRDFYLREMRPFVEDPDRPNALAAAGEARLRFERLKTLVPPAMHETVDDLASICEEERQLIRQRRLHRILHGWLLVHVPISFALLALSLVHIVVALQY